MVFETGAVSRRRGCSRPPWTLLRRKPPSLTPWMNAWRVPYEACGGATPAWRNALWRAGTGFRPWGLHPIRFRARPRKKGRFSPLTSGYLKIDVYGQMCELDSADAWSNILHRPLTSDNIEKLNTRGTYMDTICNGVGDHDTILVDKEFRIKEIGMIC